MAKTNATSSPPTKRPRAPPTPSASQPNTNPPAPVSNQTNPSPVVHTHPLPIDPTNPRAIVPNSKSLLRSPAHKERYDEFDAFESNPKPTLYPDQKTFEELEIYDKVKSLLCASGLSVLFEPDPGMSHRLILEFVSTFEPVYDEVRSKKAHDKQKSKGKNKGGGKEVKGWSFVIGGDLWEIDRRLIAEGTKLPVKGVKPSFSKEDRDVFRKKISGTNEFFVSSNTNGRIKEPVWKVIHRIVGESFFAREEGARFISNIELDLDAD